MTSFLDPLSVNADPNPNHGILIRYGNIAPSDRQLSDACNLDSGFYTYVVATAAQADLRKKLAPPHQMDSDGIPQMVFHQFLRHLLNRQLLSRSDERVSLKRAAKIIANDDAQSRLLKHDAASWREALARLDELGVDLSEGWPEELYSSVVNPGVGELLTLLQAEYRHQRGSVPTFEEAAFRFVEESFVPTPTVVMEGFAFFTPIQKRFLEACLAGGARVYLVRPGREGQRYGFEAPRRVYGPFTRRQPLITLETPPIAEASDLDRLQCLLFADVPDRSPIPLPEEGVYLEDHRHRHQEVSSCIGWIQGYLREGVQTEQIAVVTRNGAEMQALLQEEAHRLRLADPSGKKVEFGVPPRLLLLTPVGRFALTLYEVWESGALNLNPDQFENLIASGWLGAHVRATGESFATARAQFFERCRTRDDWFASLDRLKTFAATHPSESRFGGAGTSKRTIELWQEAVRQTVRLCERLFRPGKASIGEHVQRLLRELQDLDEASMGQTERELLERLRDALLQVAESGTLKMSTEEFADELNGLASDYGRSEDVTEGPPQDPAKIWVTTPEGIDGRQRDIVFYLGVDDLRCPRPFSESWPFFEYEPDRHEQLERYMFLTTVRSAKRKLHLSFARLDRGENCRPSRYLEEAAAVLGRTVSPTLEIEPLLPTPEIPAPRPNLKARREHYSFSEIAHFGLCPHRYKLEGIDADSRRYEGIFQTVLLAQGVLLGRTFEDLCDHVRPVTGSDSLYKALRQSARAVWPSLRADFPGLRPLDWIAVGRQISRSLRSFADYWGTETYSITFARTTGSSLVLPEEEGIIQVDAEIRYSFKRGIVTYPVLEELTAEEWLLPGNKSEESNPSERHLGDAIVFSGQYHAVQWWQNALRVAFKNEQAKGRHEGWAVEAREEYAQLQEKTRIWIQRIEEGHYPKHRGPHCVYCPVRGDCLGLEEDNV